MQEELRRKVEISFYRPCFQWLLCRRKILPSEDCEVLAVYLNGPFTNHPALIKRANMYYLSTVPEIGLSKLFLLKPE